MGSAALAADETPSPPQSDEPTAGGRSKLLCLIRHGQGIHNIRSNPLLTPLALYGMMQRDAGLTEKGREQARSLSSTMSSLPFETVLVSPLSRAIQTATEIFQGPKQPPMFLSSLLCERCIMPADEGTPASQLVARHPQIASWQGLEDLEEKFWPPRSMSNADEEVAARVPLFKDYLLQRPESCMAVVGHSVFFSVLTGERKLANCEPYWCELRHDGQIVACTGLPVLPVENTIPPGALQAEPPGDTPDP